ncbi:PTS sugar transporter subunit IIB [Clostridium tarantellae]|uniref:PTS sugar transporter subunit IIB n=1 Tax=Clostridium tarantellae TaxID=39493 RepID=A0A6I1MS59_9CLOT|nr:PTS sugar transporter subunit IIB [Clostridium tarantellae]MPQ45027.1 PTS sugar transporter subunit IIB [Clostridium tarantellae]
MNRIVLICSIGMSTTLLVSKMKASAKEKGINCTIKAISELELKKYENEVDVVLLGPQVKFMFKKLQNKFQEKCIPVDMINTVDYGTMNGEKVLKQALNLLQCKRNETKAII